ncbi:MAG: hypothetical protein A2745_00965 [Candidatus Harrisonbacteria bacterium RIFCSPHIGHO2_01_FULL_44_13]|uniref:Uncharacterized protein n=1 Tax=Candidatus Harrisonbacteria bacterium RIFCSPLOWO2_01_FULL_44_18 TaxID=1798407 RepID=A0A1G1ZLR5_9BACT|nr:MAG: hypothetical protein A2745_00965 [Candidatus Harrisonbacteria bacterium RIFCSPHIGHO2_01_FULL_44_13]OGY65481.1 MAG: hypothetical protein A3A16_03560 [Candidatus Harrisonbacteria bacterium RIFCSPLOWO2_01_FULL_44_18]
MAVLYLKFNICDLIWQFPEARFREARLVQLCDSRNSLRQMKLTGLSIFGISGSLRIPEIRYRFRES